MINTADEIKMDNGEPTVYGVAVTAGKKYKMSDGKEYELPVSVLPEIAKTLIGKDIRADAHSTNGLTNLVGSVRDAWVEDNVVKFKGGVTSPHYASIMRKYQDRVRFSIGSDIQVADEKVTHASSYEIILTTEPKDEDAVMLRMENKAVPFKAEPKAPEDEKWNYNESDYTVEQLIRACAWVADKPADQLTKSDCKLPHHKPDGTVVLKGVQAAEAAIRGARGGVDIPSKDMSAVKSHIEKELHRFNRKAVWESGDKKMNNSEGDEMEIEELKAELSKRDAIIAELRKDIEGYEVEKKARLVEEIASLEKTLKMENSKTDDLMSKSIAELNGIVSLLRKVPKENITMDNTADDGVDANGGTPTIKTWSEDEGTVSEKIEKALKGELKVR